MTRVAQLDSLDLDNELKDLFWKRFKKELDIQKNEEEWNFLLDSLIYIASSFSSASGTACSTYSLQLTCNGFYNCKKRTLFIITVLKNYLKKKISHTLFSNRTDENHWIWQIYKISIKLYGVLDLFNLIRFMGSSEGTLYLSPLYRLLNIHIQSSNKTPAAFYENTIFSNIQFQNRQLLWNAILELFNMTLLNNSKWLQRKFKPAQLKLKGPQNNKICTRCDMFPVNPYSFQCCQSVYCYVCAVKSLEISQCLNCGVENNLEAKSVY